VSKVVLNQVIKIPIPKTANKTAAKDFIIRIPKSGKLVSTYSNTNQCNNAKPAPSMPSFILRITNGFLINDLLHPPFAWF
jgi:hypothetical protein